MDKMKRKGKNISPCNENARIYPLSFPIYYSAVLATVIIMYITSVVVTVQSPSHVWLFATTWTAAHQASLSLTISRTLPKFRFIAAVMPSSHLILWCPLLLLPSIFPSLRDFSNELSFVIRWPKYWSFSSSIRPSSEYSRLISLKIDWSDLLAVLRDFQGSSPALQFEGINSLMFCLLYDPSLTTPCDHWEDLSLNCMDLCQQRNVSAFPHIV